MRSPLLAAAFAGAMVVFSASESAAQTPLETVLVASELTRPVYVCSPPGDYNRLFIVEQDGLIKIHRKGAGVLATPFLDVTAEALCCGERGLLGLAFHPDYASNGRFFVNYTDNGGDTVIAEYGVSANPNIADPTATIVFGPYNQPQPNHNGGCLQFGPDGKLYCGMGDGGNGNDTGPGHATGGNAQSDTTLLGKMIRLDVDIAFPHIPTNNPYLGAPTTDDLAWAYGVRNPWRFSFDRGTGDMYIGDVGQGAREEISWAPAGMGKLNYGWRCMEGFNCTGLSGCTCNAPELTLPIHDYSSAGNGCAVLCTVIGGYVYRGCAIPDLDGTYFFADYGPFTVWSFEGPTVANFTDRTTELTPTAGAINRISSFGEDAFGELYITDYSGGTGGGELWKIVPENMADCNGNLIADECEIQFGLETDCNLNGIPDSCEVIAPVSYCTAGTSASTCTATLSSTGVPSASASSGFTVDASNAEGSKDGIFFYGFNGPQANSWGTGTSYQCVVPPVTRTPLTSGGGASGTCNGNFSRDMNAFWSSAAPSKVPSPGTQVHLQLWYRDPQNTSNQTTSLSDGLEFWVCP